MTDTQQPSDHTPPDIVTTLAHMPFQALCQAIITLPDSDEDIEKLRTAAGDEERSRIDLLIALRSTRLGEIAPLFATADDDPSNTTLRSSDVPDNMLALLTALNAVKGPQ